MEGRELLSGFHARVQAGDFIVLSGSSGAGKSTLLRAIHRPEQNPALRKSTKSTFLSQSMALTESLSPFENVLMGELDGETPWWKSLWTLPEGRRERALGLLEKLQLNGFRNQTCGSLSGGEKARIALARCLLKPALLFLADEPTAALDSANARVALELLKTEVSDRQGAVICVLHSPSLAEGLATALWTWDPLTKQVMKEER